LYKKIRRINLLVFKSPRWNGCRIVELIQFYKIFIIFVKIVIMWVFITPRWHNCLKWTVCSVQDRVSYFMKIVIILVIITPRRHYNQNRTLCSVLDSVSCLMKNKKCRRLNSINEENKRCEYIRLDKSSHNKIVNARRPGRAARATYLLGQSLPTVAHSHAKTPPHLSGLG
jgi:hypothetical protein